jgi:hypothetical protein
MKKIFNFKTVILAVILCVGLLSSCKDQETLGSADRLFRPIVSGEYGGTWIKLNWDRYKGAKSYELLLSVDSFKTILRHTRTDSTQFTYNNLDYDTKYQISIRSIGDSLLASGDTIKSKYAVLKDITTTDYPTLLIDPTTATDIIDNSVIIKWTVSSPVYTRIDMCVKKDSVYESVNLTTADNSAGTKIVTGLKPATTYYAKIYQGNAYMGKKTFKTANAQIFIGDVVDLRGYSDSQAATLLHQTFIDTLAINHPNGLNLILSGGTSYTIGTVSIPVSMNIVTGLSFKGKAIMAINGNFTVPAVTAGKVGSIRFEKVFFTEGNIAGKTRKDGNYGATYLFNFNQSGGNLDSLKLENCDVKYKRAFVRLQTTANINYLSINNCLFDSIADYGIINNGNDASYIGDIVFKNSTVLHANKLFTCGKAKGINSITIDHVTSCYSPAAGAYFLDYNTNLVPGGITITNSLFGIGGGTAPALVNGMRSSCSNINISNCFRATDLGWVKTADGSAAVAPINDFVDFGLTTTQIFTDPTNSNYKVTDTKLKNKIGDPRWW